MIVAKFGGSSVRDAQSMRNCAQIIERNPDMVLVILSATYNTTNELDFLFSSFLDKGHSPELQNLTNDLILRHRNLAQELLGNSCAPLEDLFSEFVSFIEQWGEKTKEKKEKNRDFTLSFGERFSTTLFFSYLSTLKSLKNRNLKFIKSHDYLKTDSNFGAAKFKPHGLDFFAHEVFDKSNLYVAQGYIGSDDEGNITTLGREGSDYSAALFAEAISADEVIIWTDVAGVFSCDPRISSKAQVIDHLSYAQASAMAKFGAKVLYPETMAPLINKKIKLWVKCTKDPEILGTLISDQSCSEVGGYAVCIEKRADGALLTHLGQGIKRLGFPIIDENEQDHFIRYYIPLKDVESVVDQILS